MQALSTLTFFKPNVCKVKPKLPYIPGMDVTGYVIQLGQKVPANALKVGDRVLATMLREGGTDGMAEVIKAPAALVYRIPEGIPLEACANIGRNYFAAYHSLKTIGNVGHHPLYCLMVLLEGSEWRQLNYARPWVQK